MAQQSGGGREVVQALPTPAAGELNRALKQLARNPQNLEALLAAGTASLALNDVDAAIGFFGRADDLSPSNPRVKAGKAAAYVRTRRPVEALRLFREAEEGGVEIVRLAADYGLAYDLVGNNQEAQAAYRRALSSRPSDEVSRRLALSLAIDGKADEFERTLRPLLANRDFAAYRARAFGLAIMGKPDDAVAITEAVMPRAMADQIAPYLRFMPRLTKAQQAAAVNLGIYPRAAQIGRDDPRIAALTTQGSGRRDETADANLTPAGQPLGSPTRPEVAQSTPAPARAASRRSREAIRIARAAQREVSSDPLTRTSNRPRVVRRPRAEPSQPAPTPTPAATPPATVVASGELSPQRSTLPASAAARIPEKLEAAEPPASAPVVVAMLGDEAPAPGFDLGGVEADVPAAPSSSPSSATVQSAPVSVNDAFSDLIGSAAIPTTAASGAVDITAIKPPREVASEQEAAAEPAKPAHPSRFWVQVATGKDRSALRFDWRRLSRKAPDVLGDKGPFVTAWGQTNRLLAGPFESRGDARKALNSLTEKGIDAFTFTSPEGQEIDQLR
ncbi:SPOR domain-containing protein [Altererythrobacter sp.]|nr:SPOR domain-containing protein [Altererythrobacter sp.]